MKKILHCELISWPHVVRLVRQLAFAVRRSGFAPDLIVAIARGGYVPARLLADALDIMALTGVRIVHYAAGAQRHRRARLVEPLRVPVRGRRVLVVDDVADSGETYRVACRHIARGQPAELRTAALHYKVGSDFVPDYYVETLTVWRWINYPWARMEDIGGFIDRMRPCPKDAATATRRLAREFGMRVPRALVQDVMRLRQMKSEAVPRETVRCVAPARRAQAGTRSRRHWRR